MLNYSTEFPIDNRNSVEDVIRLACEWITGSPHTKIPEDALDQLPLDAEAAYSVGEEHVTVAMTSGSDFSIGGLRYVRIEERGLEWTTTIVTLKGAEQHLISVRVTCDALNTAVRLPPPKKPYFIRQAVAELGGGMDGEVPVTDRPFRLSEGEEEIAAALMTGTARNRLPIVYVSAGFDGSHALNAELLAKIVSGLAHVVVEPSRLFSQKVKSLSRGRNAFGGTVGVYWPESSARKSYYLSDELPDANALQFEIAKDIRLALSNRRPRTTCTWTHLSETLSRKRYELLKSQGSTELNAFIDAFDSDLAAKDARILEAEAEIARLNAENRRLTSVNAASGDGLLSYGDEQDLYENEIADIVIDSLKTELRNTRENGRRQHVVTELLRANEPRGRGQEIAEEIRNLFKTYTEMDSRTRSALARLGFFLSDDGKHHKAVFQGDGRYTFAISKTSSDHRGGKNLASDINGTLF